MTDTLMSLRRTNKRNALQRRENAPIDGLPTELLAEIFMFLRQLCLEDAFERFYSWCAILLVSTRWYNVALRTPLFWDTLDLSVRTPSCFFERSYMLPLVLHWAVNDSQRRALHQFSGHFFRCSHLILSSMPDDNGQRAFDGFVSIPLLEELCLTITSDSSPLADVFVSGIFPRLASLRFSGVLPLGFQWSYTIFASTVRQLYINTSIDAREISLTGLISALQRMPLLETLTLWGAVPDTDDAILRTSPATLDNLTLLSVAGTVRMCASILNALLLRPSVNIDVTCHAYNDDNPADMEGYLVELSQALRDKLYPQTRSVDGDEAVPPLRYMHARYGIYPDHEDHPPHAQADLYCSRIAMPLERVNQRSDLDRYERMWCDDFVGGPSADFEGMHVTIISWIPDILLGDRSMNPPWLRPVMDNLPLEDITTVATSTVLLCAERMAMRHVTKRFVADERMSDDCFVTRMG